MKRAAQLTLQRAVEQEVDEFLGRARYERTGEAQPGHRNGYETKPLHSAEGTLEIEVPQLRGTLEPFESVWLRAIGKRSDRLMELIPLVYVKGMSHRDIEAALVEALGVEQTGRTVVRQVCQKLRGKFDQWQDRDLSMYNIEYLFLDGIYLKLRPEDKRAVAILCAYGITENAARRSFPGSGRRPAACRWSLPSCWMLPKAGVESRCLIIFAADFSSCVRIPIDTGRIPN
jgi:transposase-like protein